MRSEKSRANWYVGLGLALAVEFCVLVGLVFVWFSGGEARLNLPGGREARPADRSVATPLSSVSTPTQVGFGVEATSAPSTVAPTKILPGTPGAIPRRPALDGKVVYVCYDGVHDQICIVQADGSGRKQLTKEPATSFYPSLSPDGKLVIFSSNRSGVFEIYSMDIDGENLVKITDDIGSLYAPEISPNGKRIVFTNAAGGHQTIWTMKIDGSNPRPINEGGIDPTWSPNGEQIAYASDEDGPTRLYIMNADGGNPHPVSKNMPAPGGRSTWSSDGKWLAYYSGPKNDHNLYRIQIDGKGIEKLTDGGDNLGPSFSPDGTWLTFTSDRNGNNDVYLLDISSREVIQLTDSPKSD
jgi:Tol biopolymer transport system component